MTANSIKSSAYLTKIIAEQDRKVVVEKYFAAAESGISFYANRKLIIG